MKHITLALIVGALALSACQSAPTASIPPAPTEHYVCEDGTRLAVRLLGSEASVAVNNEPAVSLPALGQEGTTFTNGTRTLFITQGNIS